MISLCRRRTAWSRSAGRRGEKQLAKIDRNLNDRICIDRTVYPTVHRDTDPTENLRPRRFFFAKSDSLSGVMESGPQTVDAYAMELVGGQDAAWPFDTVPYDPAQR